MKNAKNTAKDAMLKACVKGQEPITTDRDHQRLVGWGKKTETLRQVHIPNFQVVRPS